MQQRIELAHPWDAGQAEQPQEANFPWCLPGETGESQNNGYAGFHIWWCFRGLAVPQGAVLTSATVQGLGLAGANRLRVHVPADGLADADPPGSMTALARVLDALGTAEVAHQGLTEAQQEAAQMFWEYTIYAETDPPAVVLASLEYVHAQYLESNYIAGVQDMVTAFGPWETAWPFNWAGWTPARGMDLQSPAEGHGLPDVAALVQELVDAPNWRPGNAVLLVMSPPEGAADDATVHVGRIAGQAVALDLEWTEPGGGGA